MPNPYSAFCEDFYINMRLGSGMPFAHTRESVLHFFERVQKQFPAMTRFRRDNEEFSLEEERSPDGYRWLGLESRRLCSGQVNPASIEQALAYHQFILQQAPFQLGISTLEIEYVEMLFGFDLAFTGNHDELVAETLLSRSPLTALAEEPGARPVGCQPSFTVSLSDDCRLQARMDVITRTSSYQVRTGDYAQEKISVYLSVRRFWGDRPHVALDQMILQLAEKADDLCSTCVIPRVLRPISEAIASRS
jgi:hypothetical protein